MAVNEFQVLLIDDDEDDFVNLRDLFGEIKASKYHLTWKSSYEEGLKALSKSHFDVCLLDYRLGARTGLELLREAQKFGIRCPTIFLTGHGDFELDLQAMQVGASDYLIKGQLTAPLLERSTRYSMKHALDMEELSESKAQILQQDRLASLGLLASSLAHEIGTPLGIIRSRAEMVEKRAHDNLPLKQDMQSVVTQIDKITKLVNSLLHLARGSKSEHASPVSLNSVIQDVLNLMSHEFERKGISLETQISGDFIVRAEPGPLGQVLLNLLVNAVHAVDEEKKSGRTDNHKVTLSADQKGDNIRILVADTGCGIPEENIQQIFKPFFTTKDVGLGTGLGLATSYKLVHSWGGAILVESRRGLGTTFAVTLSKA